MRRQLLLLVAATTTLVTMAFVVPLGVLVDRTAEDIAVVTAADSSQRVVPAVAAAEEAETLRAAAAQSKDGYAVRVLLPSGKVLGAAGEDWAIPSGAAMRGTVHQHRSDGTLVIHQPVVRRDGTAVISTQVSAAVLSRGVLRAWGVLAVLALALIALSLVVADWLARAMTGSVSDLARTADRMGRGDLSTAVQPAGPPEIREVGLALNALGERIHALLGRERERAADLSHRLRTPLAALRLDTDALSDADERRRISDDVDGLVQQVDAVIHEARHRPEPPQPRECDAVSVLLERAAFWEVLAQDQSRRFALSLPDSVCLVWLPPLDLAAALDVLLENVFAHTPGGTPFEVGLRPKRSGGAVITVHDKGPGFAQSNASPGHSGKGSTGLGLDIARRTAEASGGEMTVERNGSGGMVRLTIGGPPRMGFASLSRRT